MRLNIPRFCHLTDKISNYKSITLLYVAAFYQSIVIYSRVVKLVEFIDTFTGR